MLNRFPRIINKPVIYQAVLAVLVLQCKIDSHELSINLLCCEAVLVVLDVWEPANEVHPVGYFSALATISNQWRDVSMGQKIRDAAHRLGGLTASGLMKSAPPRALRGRWGSSLQSRRSFSERANFWRSSSDRVHQALGVWRAQRCKGGSGCRGGCRLPR